MTASDTTSLVLAASASAASVVAVGMWRRARRRRRAVRARHPSVQPPMAVDLVPGAEGCSLRVDVRPGAPPLSLDIVSYRPAAADGTWESVPIVDPVPVESGGPAMLPTTLPPSTDAADVVIAWTAHHPTGELQDSRLLRVPASRHVPAAPSRAGVLRGRLTLTLIGLLAGSMVLVARSASVGDAPEQVTPFSSATTEPLTPSNNSTSDLTVETSPITPSPSTAPPVTPTDPPVTTVVATATAAPATAPAATSTTEPDGGPRVLVEARRGPCRFADDCLIVGFAIEGFDSRPQHYVCEFDDGSRFTFRFDSDGVDDACATGSAEGSIAVEVEGVRSATVTRADV